MSVAPNSRASLLPGLVPAHRDDPVRAELLGGQNGEQADRAVPDHGDGLARAGFGGDGAEPAGAENIGGGQEAGQQIVGGDIRCGDQGAVGQRHPQQLGLRALRTDWLTVDAGALVAGPADVAGVVGGEERPDHELAGFDRGDRAADFFDDPDVFMAHR